MQSGDIAFGLKYLPDEPANTDAVSLGLYSYIFAWRHVWLLSVSGWQCPSSSLKPLPVQLWG